LEYGLGGGIRLSASRMMKPHYAASLFHVIKTTDQIRFRAFMIIGEYTPVRFDADL
jgi:hypothetical protein